MCHPNWGRKKVGVLKITANNGEYRMPGVRERWLSKMLIPWEPGLGGKKADTVVEGQEGGERGQRARKGG
jgi:hypothetical protein